MRRAKHALLARLRHLVSVDAVAAEVAATQAALDAARAQVGALEAELARLRGDLDMWLPRIAREAEDRFEGDAALLERLRAQDRLLRVHDVMAWLEHVPMPPGPTVTVVLPTRDRAGLLRRAIDSVFAQRYERWELVVVDDGSTDETAALLRSIDDPRVVTTATAGVGACGARNAGLDKASGELIAYLDDDNVLHPGWLKAVAWAFDQHPDVEVLYGAFVVDDHARVLPGSGGELPKLFFLPYDRAALARANVADMSAIAHRAGLPEARFDESLVEMGDWDLLLRLTRDRPPLDLPVVAAFYTTDAPARLSGGPTYERDRRRVQEKNAR